VAQQQRANVLCSLCQRILRGWFPTPIDVVYGRPVKPYHLLETSQPGFTLLDRRLLDRLREWLPLVAIGRALDRNGEEIGTHAVFYAQPESVVAMRYGPTGRVNVCPECSTIRQTPAEGGGESYLLAYDIAGRSCVLDRVGSIFLSGDVASKLNISDLRPLFLEEVEVLDEPSDGLRFPNDPPHVKGRDATVPWDPTKGDA
jgi:hypothetical protein